MPGCETCESLGRPCTRSKSPHQTVCMRCVRMQVRCYIADASNSSASFPKQKKRKQVNHRRKAPRTAAQEMLPEQAPLPSLSQQRSSVGRISISLDPGSSYTKGCFRVFRGQQDVSPRVGIDSHVLHTIQVINWPNRYSSVETQLAYEYWNHESDGSFKYHQLWGHEVTIALEESRISPQDVFRSLKPAIYSDKAGNEARNRIESQIQRLPEQIQFSRREDKAPFKPRKLTHLDLFSDYLGHAWRFLLVRIKEMNPDLPWPEPGNPKNYHNFDPTRQTSLDVVISVPADSRPHHVRSILDAAKGAGIPRPYPVAEPAAAFAYDIQRHAQAKDPIPIYSSTLVLDIGGGSVDVQIYSIVKSMPLVVKEEVQGADGWFGGIRVNATFRMLMGHQCRPYFQEILKDLEFSGRAMSQNEFLDEAGERFESKKRDWIRGRDVRLMFPRLQQKPLAGLWQDCIHVPDATVTQAFDSSIDAILILVDQMFASYHRKYPSTEGTSNKRIGQILLVGGGGSCEYVKERLRAAYSCDNTSRVLYAVDVRVSDEHGSGSTTNIVQGALLLMLDRAFIAERVIRRGYCVGLDEPCTDEDKSSGKHKILRDPADGMKCRIDVSRFLIRIGQRINTEHRARGPTGCWRGLFLDEKKLEGWTLEERIYCSDTCSEDGVWINDPNRNDIKECGKLKFVVSEEDAHHFEEKVSPVKGRRYLYLEYLVELVIVGIDMTYRIVIPRSGKFRQHEEEQIGEDSILKQAKLECTADFDLFNTI